MQQWIVLTALWRTDALGESDLAQYCKTTPSATNRLIDRMVKAGLVQRSADPEDGRRVVVSLGPEGEARRSLLTFYEDINDTLLAGFSASETLQLAALLERLIENAKAAIELDAR